MKLHKRISVNAKYLTKLEKELLQLLLENKSKFTYDTFTIINISEEFNISSTSVHRLSKKLGYKSFIQFKDEYFEKDKQEDESILMPEDKEFIENMLDTYKLVKQSNIDEIVSKMLKCKRITIYGMGMSNYLGKMFQIKLQLLGIPAEQHDDSRFMRLSSRILKKDEDLVFVLSRGGETPELLEVLVETNMRGIDVVLITEYRNSTSEKLSKYVVYTAYTHDFDNNIDTRLNFHIAMDYIIKEFIKRYEEKRE